jgi:Skp family chaperone for outer membrane proteins
MKPLMLTLTCLLVAGLAQSSAAADSKPRKTAAAAQRDKATAQTKQAAKAARDYAFAQRAEFAADMKKDLVEIQAELDRLSAKVGKLNGTAKTDAKTRLDTLHDRWAQAKKQLDRAEDTTESAWDEVKDSFNKAHGELKESFDSTRQWLSDKIAP